jgi:hypothetical protein
VPSGFPEFFLPINQSFTKALAASASADSREALQTGLLYSPVLVAAAQVRFLDRRYGLDIQQGRSVLVSSLDPAGRVRWEDHVRSIPEETGMDPAPDPQGRFLPLYAGLSDPRQLATLKKDFADWVFRTSQVTIRSNPAFGLFATPDVSQAEFMKACAEAARAGRDNELTKINSTFDRQINALKDKVTREERELQQDQTELSQRKREELVDGAETVFSLLGGKRSRRLSSTMSKHRMTEQSKAEVEESLDALEEYQKRLTELEELRRQALEEAGSKWGSQVNNIEEIRIPAKKTDIYVRFFGIAWFPYYQANADGTNLRLPAFD